MRGRTWQPAKPKTPPKPELPNDVRAAINALVSPVVAKLKKKFCQTPKRSLFN